MTDFMRDKLGAPKIVDWRTFQVELDVLQARERRTRARVTIAAARRRLPMVEVDPTITSIGPHGPGTLLEVFECRRQLIAYVPVFRRPTLIETRLSLSFA